MFNLRDLRPGLLCWCDTARNEIGQQFSEKEFRPVLIVSVLTEFGGAAAYPCSRVRDLEGRSDQVSEPFGETETHIVYGMGLYLVQPDDLHAPAVEWSEWNVWSQTHRKVIQEDLAALRRRPAGPRAGASSAPAAPALKTRLADSVNPETLALLEKMRQPPPPAPKPPAPPKPATPPPPPVDLFKQAVDAIQPYHILRAEEEPDSRASPSSATPRRRRRN